MSAARPAPFNVKRNRRRQRVNRLFIVACVLTASASVIILGVLLASIGGSGWKHLSWDFLNSYPSRHAEKAGLKAAVWGSIAICAVCALAALPLGVGTAVLLEEFKPRSVWGRRFHGFIELNIRNLAGVPSIVYGIIAMTAFVQMFGLFGNLNEPSWSFGQSWHDQYFATNDVDLYDAIGNPSAPALELIAGATIQLETADGLPVNVQVLADDADAPADESVLAIYSVDEPYRADRKAWYYLQLPFGRGVLAGGLTLMLVVLPIVIISASEALRAVPNSLREGALAAGATRWQMVWKMTLPSAIPGIMTGSILAMSRAIGEAAPILVIAGGLVFIRFTPQNLMDEFTAMPLQIYNWASRPQEEFHSVAATGIIVLLGVLFLFNGVAVIIRQIFQKPLQ